MCDADECDELVRRVGEFENLTCVMLMSVTSWCNELANSELSICDTYDYATIWCDELANSRT